MMPTVTASVQVLSLGCPSLNKEACTPIHIQTCCHWTGSKIDPLNDWLKGKVSSKM